MKKVLKALICATMVLGIGGCTKEKTKPESMDEGSYNLGNDIVVTIDEYLAGKYSDSEFKEKIDECYGQLKGNSDTPSKFVSTFLSSISVEMIGSSSGISSPNEDKIKENRDKIENALMEKYK